MPHMVIFRNAEGKSGNHMTESLEDAARFVEHLRNNEQVTDARVFRMQEVQLEFKVMYKVEINEDPNAAPAPPLATTTESPAPAPAPAPAAAAAPAEAPTPAPPAAEPVAAPAAPSGDGEARPEDGGGRFGLFSRS